MENKKYTAEQKELALKTDLRALLSHFGFSHLTGSLFENPFKTEKSSHSFSVFESKSKKYLAKDLSSGKTWNCIDFLMEYKNMTFLEATAFLLDFSNVFVPSESYKKLSNENNIVLPMPIFKPCEKKQEDNLNYYLKIERGISPTLAKKYIKYLQYEQLNKTYYALCFRNNSKGYAARNKNFKGTFGNSDFTTIEPQDKHGISLYSDWVVFEGFIDFLSSITYYESEFKANIMVLNSTIHTQKAINYMLDNLIIENPTRVFCFLDNDEAGEKAFEMIFEQFAEIGVFNYSKKIYPSYNDFNDFLTNKKPCPKKNNHTKQEAAK